MGDYLSGLRRDHVDQPGCRRDGHRNSSGIRSKPGLTIGSRSDAVALRTWLAIPFDTFVGISDVGADVGCLTTGHQIT